MGFGERERKGEKREISNVYIIILERAEEDIINISGSI
jgi:hypothetical protein